MRDREDRPSIIKRMNGHAITVLVAVLQVVATLVGAGVFIRSVEKTFDERINALTGKMDRHLVASQRTQLSMTFHHSISVQCSKGCHIDRAAEFDIVQP